MCKRITDIVRTLRQKRDMSLNEIRLTLAIEDPVAKERRDYLEVTVCQRSFSTTAQSRITCLHSSQ